MSTSEEGKIFPSSNTFGRKLLHLCTCIHRALLMQTEFVQETGYLREDEEGSVQVFVHTNGSFGIGRCIHSRGPENGYITSDSCEHLLVPKWSMDGLHGPLCRGECYEWSPHDQEFGGPYITSVQIQAPF